MSYSLSGSQITQSGTDTDLTGLAAIAGVTFIQTGTGENIRRVYDLGTLHLRITGTQNINPYIEELITAATGNNGINVLSGGVLNINGSMTLFGEELFTERRWFTHRSVGAFNLHGFQVASGGTLNWRGGEALVSCSFLFFGNINIKNAVIDQLNILSDGTPNTGQAQIRQRSLTAVYDGLKYKRGILSLIENPVTFQGYKPEHCTSAITFSTVTLNVDFPIRGYLPGGANLFDISMWAGSRPIMINSGKGTDLIVAANIDLNTTSYGYVKVYQEFNPVIKDASSVAVQGASIFIQDYDNGNRGIYTSESYVGGDETATRTYSSITNASGNLNSPLEVYTGFVVKNSGLATTEYVGIYPWDRRSKSNSIADDFDVFVASYLHSLTSYAVNLKGVDVVTQGTTLFLDASITQSNRTTVDAYTSIDTPQKFYDRAKSFLVSTYSGELQTLVSRVDDTINAGTYDVDVDATAVDAFDFDGTTITIKASTFTGNIVTTGTVSFLNGAQVTGFVDDSTGTSTIVRFS